MEMEMQLKMMDQTTNNDLELQPKEKLVDMKRTETEEKESKPKQGEQVDDLSKTSKLQPEETDENILMDSVAGIFNYYTPGNKLGKGSFGCIYAAVRKSDGKKVALKIFVKNKYTSYITLPGDTRRLPIEVALLELVCKPPQCPNVIQLLEWFDTPKAIILVLERPEPCIDLFDYIVETDMSESEIELVMKQIILAACHCRDRGVFHRDIKAENILFNPRTCEVKLIDFGCGELRKDTPYRKYAGTQQYIPPEMHLKNEYKADPATVWSLGVLMYILIYKQYPFYGKEDIVKGKASYPYELSKASMHLMSWCLERNPKSRPTLYQMLAHHWFQKRMKKKSPIAHLK